MAWWPDLSTRRRQPERMDDPSLPGSRHRAALRGLDRLQVVSRTAARIWSAAKPHVAGEEVRWLDVACGSGRILRDVTRRADTDGVRVRTVSVDLSATAAGSTGRGVVADARRLPLADGSMNVASCSLFLHHLEPEDVIAVLQEMSRVARVVIVDDLRRTRTGHLLAHAAGRLFSRSPVVHYDGPVSVEGAFTTDELTAFAEQAGLTDVRAWQQWPQRTLIVSVKTDSGSPAASRSPASG